MPEGDSIICKNSRLSPRVVVCVPSKSESYVGGKGHIGSHTNPGKIIRRGNGKSRIVEVLSYHCHFCNTSATYSSQHNNVHWQQPPQHLWANKTIIIINEISMTDLQTLFKINKRCNIARSLKSEFIRRGSYRDLYGRFLSISSG